MLSIDYDLSYMSQLQLVVIHKMTANHATSSNATLVCPAWLTRRPINPWLTYRILTEVLNNVVQFGIGNAGKW